MRANTENFSEDELLKLTSAGILAVELDEVVEHYICARAKKFGRDGVAFITSFGPEQIKFLVATEIASYTVIDMVAYEKVCNLMSYFRECGATIEKVIAISQTENKQPFNLIEGLLKMGVLKEDCSLSENLSEDDLGYLVEDYTEAFDLGVEDTLRQPKEICTFIKDWMRDNNSEDDSSIEDGFPEEDE